MPSRNTTIRDHHRNRIKRGHPPCGICGQPIDYALPYLHPGSYVVDHIIPTRITGLAGDVLANKQAAHRACNRAKSDKVGEPIAPRSYSTPRTWCV
jgi:5-methylcytosine-specific restriction endonuclease McrA